MIKKCFVLTQFGSSHTWTQKYFDNIATLEKYGWYWKIFTPNKYEKIPSNVEIIPMTIEELNVLMFNKIGVNPENKILTNGTPSKHVSDFYVASGKIFEDYLKGFDYWGITNWDIVYGRLDKFLPDSELTKYDVWTDDVNTINGIFCLFKNEVYVNLLFMEIPHWKEMFTTHQLFGTDEYHMTDVMKIAAKEGRVRYGFPEYYPLHSYDRLEQHVPDVKLEIKSDGSLWELFKDTKPPAWIHARPFSGREIAYFHFINSKRWPIK